MESDHSIEILRLFVAIRIPEPVGVEIIRVQQELQSLLSGGAIRWTRPDQFHLTLRFLGEVPADRVENLKASVNAACLNDPPLRLSAGGIGFFPEKRSPQVIWVGIKDQDGCLAELQKRIAAAVQPFTADRGVGKFAAHVTIGRVKQLNPSGIRKLTPQAQVFQDRMFGTWTAKEMELIQSELLPAGAHHTTLAVFRLIAA